MILGPGVKAYVCREPIDMRKSIDGLAQLVGPLLKQDALCGSLFVFLSRGRDKVKILWWDRHGFWLAYKRLERGRFPAPEALAAAGISSAELMLWLEGVDLVRTRRLSAIDVAQVA
jgi:transposase